MRPAEIPHTSIIQAGQDLQAAGRNITGFALRQKVGGGNPARLKQVWDEHLASLSVAQTEPVAELPVEVAEEVAAVTKALTERLAMLAVELNDKAVKAAERRVNEVVRSAGEMRAQAERELADASEAVDELEIKLDETKAEAAGFERQLADALSNNQMQAVELAQLRERLVATELAAKTSSEQHAAERDQVRAELTRVQSEGDNLRTQLAAVSEKLEATSTRERLKIEEAATAKAEAVRLSDQLKDQKTRSADVIGKLERSKQTLEAELITSHKESRELGAQLGKATGELEALRTQVASQADLIKRFSFAPGK